MAFELTLTDRFKNTYPNGYRMLVYFAFDKSIKSMVATFNNYPDVETRNINFDNFIDQTTYRIGPQPQPAVTDASGVIIKSALPAYDDYVAYDASHPSGTVASIYMFAKQQVDNADAVDV